MRASVLVLLGTRKGAFILESDAGRADWSHSRPVLRDLADEPRRRRSGDRHDLCRRRQRVVRPGGLEIHRSRRELDAFERRARNTPRARSRSSPSGAWPPHRAGFMPASSRPACSGSDDGGETWQHCRGIAQPSHAPALAAGRCRADPPRHRAPSRRRAADLGRHLRRPAYFTPPMAARAGSRAIAARAADYLPEGERYPEFGQCVHCLVMAPGTTRSSLSAEPLRHVSQRRWRPALGEHRGRAALELRLSRRRSSARPRDAVSPAAQRRHGGPLRARGEGGGVAHPRWRRALAGAAPRACRRTTRSSACCARPWRPTGWTPPAIYFGTGTGTLFASADEGESWTAIAQHLPAILSVETLVLRTGSSGTRSADVRVLLPNRSCGCFPGSASSWTSKPPRLRGDRRRSIRAGPECATACAIRRPASAATSRSSSRGNAPTLATGSAARRRGADHDRDQRGLELAWILPHRSCAITGATTQE